MTITPTHYLVLAAIIFCIGLAGVSIRKNALVMFMSVELMLNAANLTFVAYSKALNDIAGQVAVFFTLVVAAAEVAVGLALMVAIFKRKHATSPDSLILMAESSFQGVTLAVDNPMGSQSQDVSYPQPGLHPGKGEQS